MQKKAIIYRTQNQQWNISDEEDGEIRAEMHFFPSKFIKQLNFQQNCQKSRQRRIKKINQLFQLRGTILENIKNDKENKKGSGEFKGPSSQNMKEIFYKGSIIKGRPKKRFLHGDTQIIYENGAQFKGILKNGKMRTGKFDFKNGYQYWGELQGKKFIGKGTLKCPNGTVITGVWNGDQIIGRAQLQYSTGDVYYGQVQKFKKHGEGYLFFKSGNKYIGHFQHGEISGYGTNFETDGTSQKGKWKNGQLIQPQQDSLNDVNSQRMIHNWNRKKISKQKVSKTMKKQFLKSLLKHQLRIHKIHHFNKMNPLLTEMKHALRRNSKGREEDIHFSFFN